MSLFLIALNKIIQLFLIIIVGFICRRCGVVGEGARKQLTAVLMNVVLPCVIVDSFLSEESSSFGSIALRGIVLVCIIYAVTIILAQLLIRRSKDPGPQKDPAPVERLSIVFSNTGFLGIPLLSAVYGESGKFCAILAMIMFYFFFWTYGAFSLSSKADPKEMIKQLLSPSLIAVLISAVMLMLSVKLPAILAEPIASIGAMNSPFAMIVTGITLAESDLQKLFTFRVFKASMYKNILVPLALAAVFMALGQLDEIGISFLTTAACPTAALVPMMALQYDYDGQLPSGIFTMSTVLSMVTLPLYIYGLSALASI